MRPLSTGKIPTDILDRVVLKRSGAVSPNVVTAGKAGVDFAAVKVPGGYMIVSADPVTGVTEDIGSYAVRVSANDVATSGTRAEFAESVILLPEGSSVSALEEVAEQVHGSARAAGISIVGGHTEVTPGLRHPIVVVTAFAFARSFVTSAGAKSGDVIMMTKTAGIEGTSELAKEHGFGRAVARTTLKKAERMMRELDITREAVAAFSTGLVHGMHDCTEGGVLGAAYEMALASGLGFRLNEPEVPVAAETRVICDALSADPLRLIGSGSLLIAAPPDDVKAIEAAVSPVKVTDIGVFTERGRVLIRKDGAEEALSEAPTDELWRLVSRR